MLTLELPHPAGGVTVQCLNSLNNRASIKLCWPGEDGNLAGTAGKVSTGSPTQTRN